MQGLPYIVQWVLHRDEKTLDLTIRTMKELQIPELRTLLSWADWEREDGPQWFDYLTRRLYQENIRLVPCLFYTPPHLARTPPGGIAKTSYPPRRLADFARFVKAVAERYDRAFEWIQLWNESNWDVYWNWEMDPDWRLFAEMMSYAIPILKQAGKKIVLGGLSPYEPEWVDKMFEYGVMQEADALGIHGFPGTWDMEEAPRRSGRPWKGFEEELKDIRSQLQSHGSNAEVWLTETGYSTFGEGTVKQTREEQQIVYFQELLKISADRIYWYSLMDQGKDSPTDNELNSGLPNDEKAYHFGLLDAEGRPKPLYDHWRTRAKLQ